MYQLLSEAEAADQIVFARVLYEQILEAAPDDWATLVLYAGNLTELSLYEEAGAALDRAEAMVAEEQRHRVLAYRGHLLEAMGDYAGAEDQHLLAHELAPAHATYLIYAASAAFRRGAIARAEELARRALNCTDGCLDEAYFNLGGYLAVQKRYEEARACYRRALEIDPDYSKAQERLADLDRLLEHVAVQESADSILLVPGQP